MPSDSCYSMIEVHILPIIEMIGHTGVAIIKLKFLLEIVEIEAQ